MALERGTHLSLSNIGQTRNHITLTPTVHNGHCAASRKVFFFFFLLHWKCFVLFNTSFVHLNFPWPSLFTYSWHICLFWISVMKEHSRKINISRFPENSLACLQNNIIRAPQCSSFQSAWMMKILQQLIAKLVLRSLAPNPKTFLNILCC